MITPLAFPPQGRPGAPGVSSNFGAVRFGEMMGAAITDMERAYFTLCWTVWMAGVELWWERWGGTSKPPGAHR